MVTAQPAPSPIEWRSSAFREAQARYGRRHRAMAWGAGAVTVLLAGGAAILFESGGPREVTGIAPAPAGALAQPAATPAPARPAQWTPDASTFVLLPPLEPAVQRPMRASTAAAAAPSAPVRAIVKPQHRAEPPPPPPAEAAPAPAPSADFAASFGIAAEAAPGAELADPLPSPVTTAAVPPPAVAAEATPALAATDPLAPPAPGSVGAVFAGDPEPGGTDGAVLASTAAPTAAVAPPAPAPTAVPVAVAAVPEPVAREDEHPPLPPPPPPPGGYQQTPAGRAVADDAVPAAPRSAAAAAAAVTEPHRTAPPGDAPAAPGFADRSIAAIPPSAPATAPAAAPPAVRLSAATSAYAQVFPVVEVAGRELGAVAVRDFGSDFAMVHLGGLLGLFRLRMPALDYARLAASGAAAGFVSLDDLRAAGLAVAYDARRGRLAIGVE